MPKSAKKAAKPKKAPKKTAKVAKTKKGDGPRGGAKLKGLIQYSFYMPDATKAKVVRLAKKSGKSQTDVVCDALAKLKG